MSGVVVKAVLREIGHTWFYRRISGQETKKFVELKSDFTTVLGFGA